MTFLLVACGVQAFEVLFGVGFKKLLLNAGVAGALQATLPFLVEHGFLQIGGLHVDVAFQFPDGIKPAPTVGGRPLDDFADKAGDLFSVGQPFELLQVAVGHPALVPGFQGALGKIEHGHPAADVGGADTDAIGELAGGILAAPVEEGPEGFGFLQGVQVLALQVLDDGQLEGVLIGQGAHDGRDGVFADASVLGGYGHLGPVAPFAAHDLMVGGGRRVGDGPDENRLNEALGFDGGHQLVELAAGIAGLAFGVPGVGFQALEGQGDELLACGGGPGIFGVCGFKQVFASHGVCSFYVRWLEMMPFDDLEQLEHGKGGVFDVEVFLDGGKGREKAVELGELGQAGGPGGGFQFLDDVL